MKIFEIFLLGLSLLKIIHFMRIYNTVRRWVYLLTESYREFKPFGFFFTTWVLMFGFIFSILDMQFSNIDDYKELNQMVVYVIQVYRNSKKDIMPPLYDVWVDRIHDMPYAAWSMIVLIWLLWFMNQIMLVLIVLTFLNGIFGARNEESMGTIE